MFSESYIDPRYQSTGPTPEEIEAWAERERARRKAWLAGPADEEKRDWALRWRLRARIGLEESRLPASQQDVQRWAEREHQRRQAWLAGPTEEEKLAWARRARRPSLAGLAEPPLPATPDEIEAWAKREREERQAWLAGPSEEEKQQWARRQAGGFPGPWMGQAGIEPAFTQLAHRFLREAELVGKGSFYALSNAPLAIWSYFVRAGRVAEQEFDQQPRRGRVPF